MINCNLRTHFESLGVPGIASGAAFLIIRLLFFSPFKPQETLNVTSERFPETVLRLASVASSNFCLDF